MINMDGTTSRIDGTTFAAVAQNAYDAGCAMYLGSQDCQKCDGMQDEPEAEPEQSAFDGLSLAMVLWVLYRVCSVQRRTYEADEDAFPAMPLALGALVLAAVFHANMNESPFFDTMWMCSVFASAISVLPQVWMLAHRRGKCPALTSHFVAVTALARVLSGAYMWHAYPEIEADPFFGNVKYAGYAVIVAHVVHLLLLGDFAFYYVKNVAVAGLSADLDLSPQIWEV